MDTSNPPPTTAGPVTKVTLILRHRGVCRGRARARPRIHRADRRAKFDRARVPARRSDALPSQLRSNSASGVARILSLQTKTIPSASQQVVGRPAPLADSGALTGPPAWLPIPFGPISGGSPGSHRVATSRSKSNCTARPRALHAKACGTLIYLPACHELLPQARLHRRIRHRRDHPRRRRLHPRAAGSDRRQHLRHPNRAGRYRHQRLEPSDGACLLRQHPRRRDPRGDPRPTPTDRAAGPRPDPRRRHHGGHPAHTDKPSPPDGEPPPEPRPQAPSRTGAAATCTGFDRDGPVQVAFGVGLREQRGERLRPGAVGLPHIRSRLWAPVPDPKMPGSSIHGAPARCLNAIASITCR